MIFFWVSPKSASSLIVQIFCVNIFWTSFHIKIKIIDGLFFTVNKFKIFRLQASPVDNLIQNFPSQKHVIELKRKWATCKHKLIGIIFLFIYIFFHLYSMVKHIKGFFDYFLYFNFYLKSSTFISFLVKFTFYTLCWFDKL